MIGGVPLVLVVEDRPSIRHLLEVALAQEAVRIASAANADDAWAVARVTPPDIVLLDLLLPGSRGDVFLRALRELPATRQTPVIVISGVEGGLEASRAAGAEDFLAKPFDLRQLLERVRYHLARSHLPSTPA
jgi:DNA-binding response OmpR family regulator